MKHALRNLIYILLLAIAGCGPDEYVPPEPKLPPATQVGANTFGCRIDGKVLIPDAIGCFAIPPIRALEVYHENSFRFGNYTLLHLSARNCLNGLQLGFEKIDADSVGTYTFDSAFCDVQYCEQAYASSSKGDFYTLGSGEITITRLDTSLKIISGTFWFNLTNGTKTMPVRDGRFDIKYPYP